MSYWVVGSLLLNTVVQYDQANNARHQNKVNQREQERQFTQAQLMQEKELATSTKLHQETLAAQARAQSASLAQAQRAAAESKALMDKQLKSADESMNRALSKRPNTARIQDEAAQAGKAGASGTMLTGSQGIDPSKLQLGRNSLLGA
ncbi:MAG: hypothetical protein U1C47_02345 [Hydrogenophaga sp.]|nr:hypothetical protein [Hydrogenophaga sp.]